jgi:membrane protease YdiL (CAAX protease family)
LHAAKSRAARLAARLGLARASLLLGVIAGCRHLPLFFVPGLGQYGQSFPLFVLGAVGSSVAIAWLYASTNGSLLLAMLMHSAVNQTVGIVPTRLAQPANPLTAIDTSLITYRRRIDRAQYRTFWACPEGARAGGSS